MHYVSRAFAENNEGEKRKPTDCHSTELIGYLTQAVMFMYWTVLIGKHRSLKSCRGFPVFLLFSVF